MIRTAALVVALASGCGTSAPPPTLAPQVQVGPGQQIAAGKVLALSASCGSVEFDCPPEYVSLVDNIVRSTMDFTGYALVDPDTLRNETREREETRESEVTTSESSSASRTERTLDFDDTRTSHSASRTTHVKTRTVLSGPGFNDLSVTERRQLLAAIGADSVLTVRIVVGAKVGLWVPNQNVEVMVKLGVNGGDDMAWASRCLASSNDFSTVDAALENAARCAVYGGTGR